MVLIKHGARSFILDHRGSLGFLALGVEQAKLTLPQMPETGQE